MADIDEITIYQDYQCCLGVCVTLLVAWDDYKLIGKDNGLPWHIPEDLKLFKKRTKGQTIVMGLKTYNGLPKKPLPDRTTIVVMMPEELETFDKTAFVAFGIKEAIDLSKKLFPDKEIFICGGASIYKQALEQNLVNRMLVSVIPGIYHGDTYFPEFPHIWERMIVEEYNEFIVEQWTREEK
jgi:dihydrofolate reductase